MFMFAGRKKAFSAAGRASGQDTWASTSPPAAEAAAGDSAWWMDSALELQSGLDVVEITDLPEGLFNPPESPR